MTARELYIHGPLRAGPRLLIVLLGIGVLLLVLRYAIPLSLAWRHYRTTPDFATFVAERPVQEPLPPQLLPEVEVLAHAGDWSIGAIDPFALAEDDPDHERLQVSYLASLRRGDELLLELMQDVAVAARRGSGERDGLALRTTRCETHPALRARVRIWISNPEQLLGADSEGQGQVVLEALLLAGAGSDRLEVAELGTVAPARFAASQPSFSWWMALGLLVHPAGALPEEGLIHRLRQHVSLSWRRGNDSGQGAGIGVGAHQVNSSQYSYEVRLEVSTEGSSTSREWSQVFTWNDRVW